VRFDTTHSRQQIPAGLQLFRILEVTVDVKPVLDVVFEARHFLDYGIIDSVLSAESRNDIAPTPSS